MTVLNKYVLLIIFLNLASCGKKECDLAGGYEFVITAELSPKQDTFRVGDTLELISVFDDIVPEQNTEQSYRLRDFDFYPTTSIRRIDLYPTISGMENFTAVIDSSKYNYERRSFASGDVMLTGEYRYENRKYDLRFFLIPNKTGLYHFSQNSLLYQGLGGDQDFEGKCRNESIREILVYLNEGDDNNIDLLRHGADTAFNNRVLNDPQEKFYDEGAYVFYVVE